ncbi:MAG TPA: hypothetical protein VNU97_06530 [Rhizomicrobium sp.]|nr:hypothetical protein [Rhizomicrobium sp.]
MPEPESAAWYVLAYAVLPLWMIAGFIDYLCHRATCIAQANGAKESILHWLMLGEVGVPLLAAVVLKINALLFGLMILCWIAHEITTHIDLQLAMRTRKVTAFEQQVHGFLEVLPVTALALLAILHWDQALSLFGAGTQRADLSLALKPLPPPAQLTALFGGLLMFGVVPYLDELWRGLRAKRAGEGDAG